MSVISIIKMKVSETVMFSVATRKFLTQRAPGLRFYSSCLTSTANTSSRAGLLAEADVEKVCSEISSINSRLANLSLMGQFYSSNKVLELPTESARTVRCPTARSIDVKNFIVEKPVAVKDPEIVRKEIINPLQGSIVKKHAIRMLVLRRKKMKKHQLKRLWERMYLRFRAYRILREKTKELEFRSRLASKVSQARQFSAEKYVEEYLSDYHAPLTPKTYNGNVTRLYSYSQPITIIIIIILIIITSRENHHFLKKSERRGTQQKNILIAFTYHLIYIYFLFFL